MQNDIRDIMGLQSVYEFPIWFIIIAFVLLAVLLVAYYWFRNRERHIEPIQESKPADVIALERLTLLEKESLLQKGNVKKFHFLLSEIIRDYFEFRYAFTASDKTTEEIQKDLGAAHFLNEQDKVDFLTVLKKTDIVKFTDEVLSKDQSLALFEKTKNFVIKTKKRQI